MGKHTGGRGRTARATGEIRIWKMQDTGERNDRKRASEVVRRKENAFEREKGGAENERQRGRERRTHAGNKA